MNLREMKRKAGNVIPQPKYQAGEKQWLGVDVLQAARQRIAWIFDRCERISVSFSGGKDSTVMTHLVCEEARKRGRKVGCLFVDLEAQYRLTIEHTQEIFDLYREVIEPYWVALPINLRNAVSQYSPQWLCWDPEKQEDWVRPAPPGIAITDSKSVGWDWFRSGMEFEEFTPLFAHWYGRGRKCASFVGIRTQESLNRWRTIRSEKKSRLASKSWTTGIGSHCYNVYPIYDWRTEDVWVYHGKTGLPYNRLYDRMYQAGLTIHQSRICQPYGDDQRRGLWLFHIIEPQTWARVVARVNGANQGALYARETGNILGMIKITKPEGHTWESFAKMLLGSMPEKTADHYRDKISVFLNWWAQRGFNPVPDERPSTEEASKSSPSWRRICKVLLRNDYWCKGLSFTPTQSHAYDRYKKMMRNRREKWDHLPKF